MFWQKTLEKKYPGHPASRNRKNSCKSCAHISVYMRYRTDEGGHCSKNRHLGQLVKNVRLGGLRCSVGLLLRSVPLMKYIMLSEP